MLCPCRTPTVIREEQGCPHVRRSTEAFIKHGWAVLTKGKVEAHPCRSSGSSSGRPRRPWYTFETGVDDTVHEYVRHDDFMGPERAKCCGGRGRNQHRGEQQTRQLCAALCDQFGHHGVWQTRSRSTAEVRQAASLASRVTPVDFLSLMMLLRGLDDQGRAGGLYALSHSACILVFRSVHPANTMLRKIPDNDQQQSIAPGSPVKPILARRPQCAASQPRFAPPSRPRRGCAVLHVARYGSSSPRVEALSRPAAACLRRTAARPAPDHHMQGFLALRPGPSIGNEAGWLHRCGIGWLRGGRGAKGTTTLFES